MAKSIRTEKKVLAELDIKELEIAANALDIDKLEKQNTIDKDRKHKNLVEKDIKDKAKFQELKKELEELKKKKH